MRPLTLIAACLASTTLAAAACSIERTTPTAPSIRLTSANDPARVDTIGAADLIVNEKVLQSHWVVRDEYLPAGFCSVEEGNVTPGYRRLLRIAVSTPNVGDADVYIGSPLAHMDPNGDGSFADRDGLFEFADCHEHFHFQHYATYKLIDPVTGRVWRAAKRGFCMIDYDPYNTNSGDGPRNYLSCGSTDHDGFQGISKGWADTYVMFLAGQYFVLDGGDGQEPVPPGNYVVEVVVNPAYAPERRKPCPVVTDAATGLCHQFAEGNYANNATRVTITIPDHPGRSGYGPGKNEPVPQSKEDEIEHLDAP
jgi:hypothetical protein